MFNIRHVGIYTENLELMKLFYCENFGFTEKDHDIENGVYISTILGTNNARVEWYKLLSMNGETLELLKYMNDTEQDKSVDKRVWEKGQSHIAITVDTVDAYYEKLQETGIVFISKPCVSPSGLAKVCFCRDPEGNFIELVEELK